MRNFILILMCFALVGCSTTMQKVWYGEQNYSLRSSLMNRDYSFLGLSSAVVVGQFGDPSSMTESYDGNKYIMIFHHRTYKGNMRVMFLNDIVKEIDYYG